MIGGRVNENGEATIHLVLRGLTGEEQIVEAIIDTVFTGYLTLPTAVIARLGLSWAGRAQALLADGSLHVFDMYIGTVMWDGQYRTIEVDEADTDPLAGVLTSRLGKNKFCRWAQFTSFRSSVSTMESKHVNSSIHNLTKRTTESR